MHTPYRDPAVKFGLPEDMCKYLMGDAKLDAPSLFNTSSKYLNNPYYRDVYIQLALRRNGTDIPGTYCIPMAQRAVAEVTDFREYARLIEAERAANPEFDAWMAARTHLTFTRASTEGYAPGTLGHAMWDFLVSTGYESDKLAPAPVSDDMTDIDYLVLRQGSLHDLAHLVTGFGTNAAGETGVVWNDVTSFTGYFSPELASYVYGPLMFILTSSLQAESLHYPQVFGTTLEAMRQGIAMGQALKRPLMMEPWETMLDWRIADIRAHLGITPGPGKVWEWTTAAVVG